MPLQQFLIDQVDIRVQWTGKPDPFYSSTDLDGFPGVRVPNSLVTAARKLEGMTFQTDPSLPVEEEWNRNIQPRFQLATQGQGPVPGSEWTLMGQGDPTTDGMFKWRPGASVNALAYPIGKRIAGDETEYVENLGESGTAGTSRLWLAFVLVRI